MCARVLAQKSEEATDSSASLLATPLLLQSFSLHQCTPGLICPTVYQGLKVFLEAWYEGFLLREPGSHLYTCLSALVDTQT